MGLRDTLGRAFGLERSSPLPLSFDEWLSYFAYGGNQYPFIPTQTLGEKQEEPEGTFEGYIQGAYKSNGVVFACMLARMALFSEARFQFRQMRSGRPGDLFGTDELAILEKPWPNATTGDLLARAMQDADLAGNFYAVRLGRKIKRMRPDWVTIVLASEKANDEAGFAIDAEVIGYIYKPGGPRGSQPEVILLPEQVCHFAPIPDPSARFRGMSWLTPVIREIMGDNAASTHKLRYFEKGATPNLAVTVDPSVQGEAFKNFVGMFQERHAELTDAYRTIFLGGGADIKVVGSDMKQIDFKATQGGGETRIAAAAGVPPIIVGLSEGLEAATYSNYGQARRRFADGTMRPLWRNMAGSLASLIEVPLGAELWYDDRDIPFLQEDEKDAADILEVQSRSIKGLTEAGFDPPSVVDAVVAGDLKRLKHTGLLSVQMQEPGKKGAPETNGAAEPLPIGAGDE